MIKLKSFRYFTTFITLIVVPPALSLMIIVLTMQKQITGIYIKIMACLFGITILTVRGFNQVYRPSFDMFVPFVPAPVVIEGENRLYYELHLTNFSTDTLRLDRLEITDTLTATPVLTLDRRDLENRVSITGAARLSGEKTFSPGRSGIVYLELSLPRSNTVLLHRLRLSRITEPAGLTEIMGGALTPVAQSSPVVLGAPLGEGSWAAVYDPAWVQGHRRVVYTIAGKARVPGRFAIDFIRLDSLGHYARGDENQVHNWYGYGATVLAVADGVVTAVRDDFTESPTLSAHPAYTADQATGNYIAIDIGQQRIAFYEHLQPGSIRVKPGQRVKKGTPVAALGFTGQTTGPHLHFHLANAASPLGAEGIPFVFEHFILSGRYEQMADFGKMPWTPATTAANRYRERPSPNAVIRFQ